MQKDTDSVNWHTLTDEQAVECLDVDPVHGLVDGEIARRRAKHGPNEMSRRKATPAWIKFLQQFHQALVYILLAATFVSAALGEWVDAAVIFGVVLVNAVVGFIQEFRAEKAIESLARMVRSEATVVRAGRRQRIPSSELVPGDVVIVQSGDSVPADLRLLDVKSLQVEEAALTGESVPVQKTSGPLPEDVELADRTNLAFAGTLATYGQARGIVVLTGDRTQMGRIATMIHEAVDISTPLTRKISEFSRLLVWVILSLAGLAFIVGIVRGESAGDMFMAAVALAVGAIPEGLPAAVTITLAIGVSRMARRNAIIRKMPAVETLGSTTVICSDKTGTLTENQMTVNRIFAGGRIAEVTGTGYEPVGDILLDGERLDTAAHPALLECLRAGLLCNDTQIVQKDGRLAVEGDPTEAALIVSAQKAGLTAAGVGADLPRTDVIPFESEHMFMATLHNDRFGGIAYKKGSLERILERCSDALGPDGTPSPIDRTAILAASDEMTSRGLRVLAFASRRLEPDHARLTHEDVSTSLTFLGLQGMIDPPRPEAVRAVGECRQAGIEVKMITGDHKGTALAIARLLGLRDSGSEGQITAITGRDLEALSDAALPACAEETAVFARVAPEQKLRLVRALQSRGHVVAMTGDGVNDAPALKQADIGVAMGITGTDVSKGAADMILTDDNFASIEAAVEEGRNVFDNLTKFITWTLPTNGGEGLIILASIMLGTALPVLPVQILWINMSTALLLGLMLVFEPKEEGIMARPPREPSQPILTRTLIIRIVMVSLFIVAGGFTLFLWELGPHGASEAEARTAVVNLIVMAEAFYLLACRSLTRPFFSLNPFSNPWIIAGFTAMVTAQLLFTYAPFMNHLFHSAPVDVATWWRIAGMGVLVFVAVELKKWTHFRLSGSFG